MVSENDDDDHDHDGPGGGGFGGQLNHNRCCWRTNSNSMMTMMMSKDAVFGPSKGVISTIFTTGRRRDDTVGREKSISTRFEEKANSTKRWRDECCYDDSPRTRRRASREKCDQRNDVRDACSGRERARRRPRVVNEKEKEEEEEEEDSDDGDEKGGYNKTKQWNLACGRSFSTTSETEETKKGALRDENHVEHQKGP